MEVTYSENSKIYNQTEIGLLKRINSQIEAQSELRYKRKQINYGHKQFD